MGRRSSAGQSARRSTAPAPVRSPPAPVTGLSGSGGSVISNIGSAIVEGMAFGSGSAIARRAVDAVFGPRTIHHETVVSAAPAPTPTASGIGDSDACSVHFKAFMDRVNNFGNKISKWQFYVDMLSECKKNNSGMLSA